MARFVRLMLAPTLFVIACANPEFQDPGNKTNNNTAKGPPDLGGFVSSDNGDMAKPPTGDMAKPTADMALMSTPDLAMSPPDMAMASGACGSITYDGICVGLDILKYCDTSGKLVTIDCWADYGASCEVIGGVADCYF